MNTITRFLLKNLTPPLLFNAFSSKTGSANRAAQNGAIKLPKLDTFTDSKNYQHVRYDGFRDICLPKWPKFFDERSSKTNIEKLKKVILKTDAIEPFISTHGLTFKGKDILEIGCNTGSFSLALAKSGAKSVFATDIVEYWARERKEGSSEEEKSTAQKSFMNELQRNTSAQFDSAIVNKVKFGFMDVTQLNQYEQYDAIVSLETLEHVIGMDVALKNMFRALRPGGFCFHEYNPFFSFTGGHSLCTLDFPFGHVLLNETDMEKYLRQYRPSEFKVAYAFFCESLNRMTLAQLRRYSEDAGFKVTTLSPWSDKKTMNWINHDLFKQAKLNYPDLTITDLISNSVWLILKKPQ